MLQYIRFWATGIHRYFYIYICTYQAAASGWVYGKVVTWKKSNKVDFVCVVFIFFSSLFFT